MSNKQYMREAEAASGKLEEERKAWCWKVKPSVGVQHRVATVRKGVGFIPSERGTLAYASKSSSGEKSWPFESSHMLARCCARKKPAKAVVANWPNTFNHPVVRTLTFSVLSFVLLLVSGILKDTR